MTSFAACIGETLIPFAAFCLVTYLAVLLAIPEHRASLARKARKLAAALMRWIRGPFASPSREHPASRALSARGWSPLSEREAAEFDRIAERLRPDMPRRAKFPAPRRGR